MFTSNKADSLRALGEIRLIAAIKEWLGPVAPPCPYGMGDDCALVDLSKVQQQILTTDSVSYGHHFDDKVSALDAGAKLIKRNLSDIAAMGGEPGPALLNLLCSPDLATDWLREFIEGIRQTCAHYEVPLVGGDISPLPEGQFTAMLSQTGQMHGEPLLRGGAQPGDTIYVTGTLGGSIYHKHYSFSPRLKEGQWLAQSGHCSAMMDITDGLGKDLKALIPEGCAAYLDIEAIPLSPDAHRRAQESGCPPIEHAFCDGEDYELLFAVKQGIAPKNFEADWQRSFPELPITAIGEFQAQNGPAPYINIKTKEALPWTRAFEHLADE